MTNKLDIALELERRGKLPPDKQRILSELRRRGSIPGRREADNAGDGTFDFVGQADSPQANQPPETLSQNINAQDVGELVGATAFGFAGGGKATVPGAALSGVGGALGEAVTQIGQHAGVIPGEAPRTSVLTEDGSSFDPNSATGRIIKAFARQSVGEAAGRGLVKGAEKIAGKALGIKNIDPAALEADKLLRKEGSFLDPAQTRDTGTFNFVRNFIKNSLIGGGRIQRLEQTQAKTAEKIVGDLVDTFGSQGSKKEIKDLLEDAVKGRQKFFKSVESGLFDSVKEKVGDIPVSLKSLKDFAKSRIKTLQLKQNTSQTRSLLEDIIGKPDAVNFETAQQLRSEILALSRNESDPSPGLTASIKDKAGKFLLESLNDAASKSGGEARRLFKKARSLTRFEKGLFNTDVIKRIVNKDRDLVVDFLTANKDPAVIRNIRKAVGPKAFRELQTEFFNKNFIQSSNSYDELGNLRFKQVLKKIKNLDDDVLKEFFPVKGKISKAGLNKADFDSFSKRIEAGNFVVRKQGAGEGSVVAPLTQSTAILGLFLSFGGVADLKEESVFLLAAPAAGSVLLTNPKFAAFANSARFSKGGFAAKTTLEAIKILGRVASIIAEEGIAVQIKNAGKAGDSINRFNEKKAQAASKRQ